MKPVRTAVVPAGGLGTRFLPVTRTVPKALLPLVDRPVIDFVASECAAAGIERMVLVIGPGKESLGAYFRPSPRAEARLASEGRAEELAALRRPEGLLRVDVVVQEEARGNGHAVLVARDAVGDEPFAMLWGDDVVVGDDGGVKALIDARARLGGGSVAGAMRVPANEVSRYGILAGEERSDGYWRLDGIVEKPAPGSAPSDLAQIHAYVFEPDIFGLLDKQAPGRGGEIWLTDAVSRLAPSGHRLWGCILRGTRFDAGERAGYAAAFLDEALGRPDTAPAVVSYLKGKGWTPPKA